MIHVRYDKETDGFQVKGTVNLGILGTMENKEYCEDNIEIRETREDFLEMIDYKAYPSLMGNLYNCLKDKSRDGESIALILQDYYNEKLQELNKNMKQFNDMIWSQMFEWFIDLDYPFWEDERAIAPQYRGRDWSEEIEHLYKEKEDEIYEILQTYKCKIPNNGTVQKPDVEKKMREIFYMFNFDGLVENINIKLVRFYYDLLKFEFEDNWDASIFCSTVCSLNGDFSLKEWNNF